MFGKQPRRPILWLLGAVAPALCLLFILLGVARASAEPAAHLGYGFNLAAWDMGLVDSLGFNWIKVFSSPGSRLPAHVLIRVSADKDHLADLDGFGNEVANLASGSGAFIEAYEIGNEVNLDASYGWGAAPEASAYVSLLCTAYARIKEHDPSAIIVSAGLAPTGRVSGNWNGHIGHNGAYQDEREYLREFVAAGGGDCADAIGYHPYGFSADYDAEPDIASADPTQNCANGFCFRGAEKFYEVMQLEGIGEKMVWATETGWIVYPPEHCLSDPGFTGREWQLVTEAKQASNLAGAFQYADQHWPWMGGVFIFNLNFNTVPWYSECEQMRYYAVEDRPAESALRDMPKNPAGLGGSLEVAPASLMYMLEVDSQPFSLTAALQLGNSGWASLVYTASAVNGTSLQPLLPAPGGVLLPGESADLPVWIASSGQPTGIYTGGVRLTASPGSGGVPVTIPVTLWLVEEMGRAFLPVVQR